MPEIPDLQVFSSNVEKQFKGKTLKKINVTIVEKLNVSVKELKSAIECSILLYVIREGKEIHFHFDNKSVLALHLMLRGDMKLFENKNEHKFTVIDFIFDDNSGLALTDVMKQANATLNPDAANALDALSPKVNFKFLKETLAGRKTKIKSLLYDQKIIRGIGNAYSDEILWDAGIHPFSIAEKIPDEKIKALAVSMKKVLRNAEKVIRRHYPDKIYDEVKEFLKVHTPKKTHSPTGGKIEFVKKGISKTYFTDEQELFV